MHNTACVNHLCCRISLLRFLSVTASLCYCYVLSIRLSLLTYFSLLHLSRFRPYLKWQTNVTFCRNRHHSVLNRLFTHSSSFYHAILVELSSVASVKAKSNKDGLVSSEIRQSLVIVSCIISKSHKANCCQLS